jgi:glycosyl transferase family 9 (putative heptosyltransferase)
MKQITRHRSNTVGSRIGVLFPGALGDFICFLPALQKLARNADVDLFARSEFADIVPSRVTVRSLECNEITRLFVANTAGDQQLQDFFGVYAAVYSWLGSRQSEFVQQLTSLSCGRARIYPFQPTNSSIHQTDYYLSCVGRDSTSSLEPEVELRPEGVDWCAQFCAIHELRRQPLLVIAPGSGAREKNWPEDFFLAVVKWWREVVNGVVVLLAGPVEEERGGIERLRANCLVASGLTLSQAAALLARSDLYLGNDSGISHLAAAVGIRTIALFGPSNARQWAPRGKRVTIVNRKMECSPCQIPQMKNCPHRACLTELHPTNVIDVLATLPELSRIYSCGTRPRSKPLRSQAISPRLEESCISKR